MQGAKRGSVAASRMLSVAREGQSLVVSSRPASPTLARSDGRRGGRRLTFAERAERSVRQQPRPLAGLVQSEVHTCRLVPQLKRDIPLCTGCPSGTKNVGLMVFGIPNVSVSNISEAASNRRGVW